MRAYKINVNKKIQDAFYMKAYFLSICVLNVFKKLLTFSTKTLCTLKINFAA